MQSLRCHFEKLDSAIYYSTLHYSLLKKKNLFRKIIICFHLLIFTFDRI